MKKFLVRSTIITASILLIAAAIFTIYAFAVTSDIRLDESKLIVSNKSVKVYSDSNELLDENSYVKYDDIPKDLVNAFVVLEDKRFFEHHGVDLRRIVSAGVKNVVSLSFKEGASTISQQLIKNTHLTNDKTVERKLKEIKLAFELEKRYSKKEILEMYLNMLYFGNGIYGIKDASEKIFGKNLGELKPEECATLAGIVKSPLYYSPINDIDKAQARRNVVLKLMRDNDMIEDIAYKTAIDSKIVINKDRIHNNLADIYLKSVYSECEKILGIPQDSLINKGLSIYTYYDSYAQNQLKNVIGKEGFTKVNEFGKMPSQVGIVCDNEKYAVTALYSNDGRFDYFGVKRSPGSTIKPFAAYLPALEKGLINPYTKINDEKRNFGNYSPNNYGDRYYGWVSATEAVAKSLNIPAVKLLEELGIEEAKKYMTSIGIGLSESDDGLAIALGGLTDGIGFNELCSAYATLANNGFYCTMTFIKEIRDANGNILYSRNAVPQRACSETGAYLMTEMLKATTKDGTAKKLSALPYDIASKTGTVSYKDGTHNTDSYCVSYTADNTFMIWQGNLSGKEEDNLDRSVTGGSYNALMMRNLIEGIYIKAPSSFTKPQGIVEKRFDKTEYNVNNKVVLSSKGEYTGIFDINHLPTDEIKDADEIVLRKENNGYILENVRNTTIKIYTKSFFGKMQLIKEILCSNDILSLPPLEKGGFIPPTYSIEVYYDGRLLMESELK